MLVCAVFIQSPVGAQCALLYLIGSNNRFDRIHAGRSVRFGHNFVPEIDLLHAVMNPMCFLFLLCCCVDCVASQFPFCFVWILIPYVLSHLLSLV